MCGKSARTVRSGGDRKRAYGNDYTGTKPETADTAKSEPKGHRAGSRPYHRLVVRPGCSLLALIFGKVTREALSGPGHNSVRPQIQEEAERALRH